MRLSESDVTTIFNKLKVQIAKKIKVGNYQVALKYIKIAAKWVYLFNFKFYDEELEKDIKVISRVNLPELQIVEPKKNHFVFFDSSPRDNRGLTQQYIRAIFSMKADLLYVCTDGKKEQYKDIFNELSSYPNARIIMCNALGISGELNKAKYALELIKDYRPDKILLHLMPWDVIPLLAVEVIKGVKKYNINLTDHAFWLGASFIDYNIEFRPFGRQVSIEKRNLNKNQLLNLPYYPVIKNKTNVGFLGFPELPANCIKIFTGGALYKMFGQNGLFFKLIDEILNISPNIIILIAGEGPYNLLRRQLKKLRNKKRIFYIGYRQDINEVFKHSDIYLDTYPISGGLMEQYAFQNAKPILSYNDFCSGYFVSNVLRERGIAFDRIDKLLIYAQKLVSNSEYRINEGVMNFQAISKFNNFNRLFNQLMLTHMNNHLWENIKINYSQYKAIYFEIESKYTHSAELMLLGSLRFRFITIFLFHPYILIRIIASGLRKKII